MTAPGEGAPTDPDTTDAGRTGRADGELAEPEKDHPAPDHGQPGHDIVDRTSDTGTSGAMAGSTTAAPAPGGRVWTSERVALAVFVGFVAVAVPLILFHFGRYHWFFRDDFEFLANRGGRVPDLLAPHGGSHWVAVPRLIYFVLWQGFGLTTYLPYQACVVALHLGAAGMLRAVMRRAGVGAWLATAAASVMILFGPGAQNIVWAFQVSFTGSLAYGLAHLLLADHDGPFGRRDLLGLGFGLLAVTSSGVGVTMVAVVGLAVLLRRGWRVAFAHTVPLAAVYGLWLVVADARTTTPFGRPSPEALATWVRDTQVGVFDGMAHFAVLAWLFVAIMAAGLVAMLGPWREQSRSALRTRLAMPVSLFLGGFLFAATSGLGRWYTGEQGARASRYVYLGAALTLPLLAVTAQALARRWRWATPVLVVLIALPIPFNLGGFEPTVFGPNYMDQRRDILTTAVRMPFARKVPSDVQPVPDAFASDQVTMGFLLTAERNGDLDPSTRNIGPKTRDEFRVRLGVAARPVGDEAPSCQTIDGPTEISPERGDQFVIPDGARIRFQRDGEPSGRFIDFEGGPSLGELTIELPELQLTVAPPRGQPSAELCPVR